MFFKTKELKIKVENMKKELDNEREKVKQREKFIDLLQKNNRELKENLEEEEKTRKQYESRTVIAETKLSRIYNAIKVFKDDNEKAYAKIKEIMHGETKHAN